MLTFYPGLSPSNVNKDAKYSVVSSRGGGMEVRLVYRISARERDLLTNDRHENLVAMVNGVKDQIRGSLGGVFYINEYHHVLVPHSNGSCVYAGTYDEILEFNHDGQLIGPVPSERLQVGDPWPGPHAGIPYVVCAGASDIKYIKVSGQRETSVHLSDEVGPQPARMLARRLAKVKGQSGGRVYINEASHLFAPLSSAVGGATYVYLGSLDDDAWFPAPDVPVRVR
ncbi:hypothetical protein AB0I90_05105 [Micromonospora wenchangensis]|uniref:hypothetical protein n=1 Tax=Micromonospora wenchangensis TaxID=1185415 RepID=UPI0033EF6D6A